MSTTTSERTNTILRALPFVILDVIAIPAASSLALLIRNPEDKRCNEVDKLDWVLSKFRCEVSDGMLLLMI